jgi:hypothetical protein
MGPDLASADDTAASTTAAVTAGRQSDQDSDEKHSHLHSSKAKQAARRRVCRMWGDVTPPSTDGIAEVHTSGGRPWGSTLQPILPHRRGEVPQGCAAHNKSHTAREKHRRVASIALAPELL